MGYLNNRFDSCIESVNWQYSAAIVGLYKYLNYFRCDMDFETNADFLYYNKADITYERYLEFAEYTYHNDMHHKIVEDLLMSDSFNDDIISAVNDKLKANTVMKKYFSKLKFDGSNKAEILNTICENRADIIKETFRLKQNLYRNFANTNLFFSEKNSISRLNGFYFDAPKKGKAQGYNQEFNKFVGDDDFIFDFIPFAFTIGNDAIFINDNSEIKYLISTNDLLQYIVEKDVEETGKTPNVRMLFFRSVIKASDFIDFDVEVILKSRVNSFFETLFLRKKSIEILKKLGSSYKNFCFLYKKNENYYIDIQKEVTDAIMNMTEVTALINMFLKDDIVNDNSKYNLLINKLIDLNVLITRGGKEMDKNISFARMCALNVREKFSEPKEKNKLKSYRTKLISALTFKDYDRFKQILLNMAGYKDISLDFAYNLFDDFESNKDIAYAFVNGLGSSLEYEKNNDKVKNESSKEA